jgi:hypothetical protein
MHRRHQCGALSKCIDPYFAGFRSPTGFANWDAVLIREVSQTNDACQAKLAEISSRLREEFDLSE